MDKPSQSKAAVLERLIAQTQFQKQQLRQAK
jgi:hypothetical protein